VRFNGNPMSSFHSPIEPEPHEVAIVSFNRETLDGLQGYLEGAGLTARCGSSLGACLSLASERTRAVVIFPDDFRWEKVVATLADLAARYPRVLPVLVTAHRQRFQKLAADEVLIVPRPAWGWTILDAIRART
jgi:hypothetical protein